MWYNIIKYRSYIWTVKDDLAGKWLPVVTYAAWTQIRLHQDASPTRVWEHLTVQTKRKVWDIVSLPKAMVPYIKTYKALQNY